MEENISNEQTISNTQATEVEREEGVKEEKVSLGKFKDAEALLNAYNSLQAEFTKRCQRVKELESAVKTFDNANAPKEMIDKEEKSGDKSITLEEKEQILKDYLKSVLDSKSKAVVMDKVGVGVKTPINRPKTIEEAGNIVKDIFCK